MIDMIYYTRIYAKYFSKLYRREKDKTFTRINLERKIELEKEANELTRRYLRRLK